VEAAHGLHSSTPAELKERLAAERRGLPFLLFRDGEARQHLVELPSTRTRLSLGRQPTSDVALTWDDEVSRTHADIECIGRVWTLVEDGRSRNGCFVNGRRIHGRRALQHGDVVRIGRTSLTYFDTAPGHITSTAATVHDIAPAVTPAQRRVLVALCRPVAVDGMAVPPSNRELAGVLYLSVETVKMHLHALFGAFGLEELPQHRKRAVLARLALERGVVERRELLEPAPE
jgi:hypothetical protein